MGFIQPPSRETEIHLSCDTARAVNRTEVWTPWSLWGTWSDFQIVRYMTEKHVQELCYPGNPTFLSYRVTLSCWLSCWLSWEMTKNNWLLQLMLLVTVWNCTDRDVVEQVRKPKANHGLVGFWFSVALPWQERFMAEKFFVSFPQLKICPGFQKVPLCIIFHWHHVAKDNKLSKWCSSTMSVHLLQWLWCFHPCPSCDVFPVP